MDCFTYLMTGATNNGGEDSPGGVITSETSLAHAGAIVNNQSGGIFVTHVGASLDLFETVSTPQSSLDTSVYSKPWGHRLYIGNFRQRAKKV